jgi:L-ascorbate metabolism protein UlaG (beta-lactamase superfamily)
VIEDRDVRVFFSGDSGYFDGFKEIGRKYGPFDLTMVETGAYDPQWPDVHMQPEESLQAHIDLRGKVLLPIHNGTFDLSLHAWHDPFDRITELAAERRLPLATPEIGRALDISAAAGRAKMVGAGEGKEKLAEHDCHFRARGDPC